MHAHHAVPSLLAAEPSSIAMLLVVVAICLAAFASRHVWQAAAAHIFHPHIAGLLIGGLLVAFLLLMVGSYSVHEVRTSNTAIQVNSSSMNLQATGFDAAATPANPGTEWFSPRWGIIAVGVVILFALAGSFRAHLHFRPNAGMILLAVLLGAFVVWIFARASFVPMTTSRTAMYADARNTAPDESQISIPPPPPGYQVSKSSGSGSSKPPSEKPLASSTKPAEAKTDSEKSGADKPAAEATAAEDSLPSWIKDTKPAKDGNFYVVVRSGKDPEPSIRELMLDTRMVSAANNVIDNQMFREPGMAEIVNIEPSYLRDHCIDKQYPLPDDVKSGDEIYVRLRFDGKFRGEVNRRYHEILSSQRLSQLGATTLAGLAILGMLYSYLRFAPQGPQIGGGQGSMGAETVSRQSIYLSFQSYVRAHPWRLVLGGAIGGGAGAFIASLIVRSFR